MKIALVYGDFGQEGGAPKVVYLLSNGLATKGHEIDALVSKSSESSKNIKIVKFRKYFKGITPGLGFFLVKNKYDVIHVHGYNTFQPFICALAKVFKNFPLVFTPHYHPVGKHPILFRRAFDLTFGKFVFKMADKVIIISPIEKQQLSKFKIPDSKIEFIPNPIDDTFFGKLKDINFKKKWDLKSRVILFVGRLDSIKGLDILIKSFKIVRQRHDNISLLIVGKDVNMLPKLEKLVIDLELDDVIFTGLLSKEDLLKAYICADVFALPSSYEAFGLTLLEAMAQGVPVVATNVGGMPYVLEYGRDGILVPYGNTNQLAEKILFLLNNKDQYKKFVDRGIERAKEFKVDNITGQLESLYKKLQNEYEKK
jgi:glycosyltransferase involved in cell wall biosynthesis